jgi:glyoxylase-like metal-dependent hydrolase (beta-lactamase superfamily II)
MVDVSEVAENIFMIDNQLFSIPKWGSVYVINEEQKALVEVGPATSIATVIDGIRKIGIKPEDISYIIVTHIHLDHAGGAGVLIKDMPQAKLVVHHKGARHLSDPSRLVQSVIEAQDSEVMARHGEVTPIKIHRLLAVYDGDTISLGDKQTIKFIDAPGHAPHEMCIYETRNGGLFAGDAVGVYIAEPDILLPYHPPPHFDLKLCLNTLERLAKLAPCLLYYSHFGVSNKVKEHLNLARDKLIIWDDIAASAVKEGAFDDISRRLTAQACAELESMKRVKSLKSLYEYLVKIHIPICAAGYTKYYLAP